MKCKKCGKPLLELWVKGASGKNMLNPITSHMVCMDCGVFYKLEPVEILVDGEESK